MNGDEQKKIALFDSERFFDDLDQVRKSRGLSWRNMLSMTGAYKAPGMLRRQHNPTIQTLAPLAVWANLSLDAYINQEPRP